MTLSMAPLLSVLTEFDFTLKAAVLFVNREWDTGFYPFWSIKHKILSNIELTSAWCIGIICYLIVVRTEKFFSQFLVHSCVLICFLLFPSSGDQPFDC